METKSNKGLIITLIVVIIVLVGGLFFEYFYFNNKKEEKCISVTNEKAIVYDSKTECKKTEFVKYTIDYDDEDHIILTINNKEHKFEADLTVQQFENGLLVEYGRAKKQIVYISSTGKIITEINDSDGNVKIKDIKDNIITIETYNSVINQGNICEAKDDELGIVVKEYTFEDGIFKNSKTVSSKTMKEFKKENKCN